MAYLSGNLAFCFTAIALSDLTVLGREDLVLVVILNADLITDRLDAGLVVVLVDLAVYGDGLLLDLDGLDEFFCNCWAEFFMCLCGVLAIAAADHDPVSMKFQTPSKCRQQGVRHLQEFFSGGLDRVHDDGLSCRDSKVMKLRWRSCCVKGAGDDGWFRL